MFQDITLSLDGAIGKKVLSLGNFKFLNLCWYEQKSGVKDYMEYIFRFNHKLSKQDLYSCWLLTDFMYHLQQVTEIFPDLKMPMLYQDVPP